jgi:cytochrome b561
MRPSVYNARYDTLALPLHWAIPALIVLDFLLAMSFGQFNPGDTLYFADAYPLHMSCGALILVLSVARLLWRLAHRRPPLPDMPWALRALARASHLLLYVFMIAAPASGWLVLSLRHQRTSVFGLFTWAWPTLPTIASMPFAQRQLWHDVLLPLHTRLSYIGIALLVPHVLAALWHHLVRHDDVLLRMLPWTARPSRSAPARAH